VRRFFGECGWYRGSLQIRPRTEFSFGAFLFLKGFENGTYSVKGTMAFSFLNLQKTNMIFDFGGKNNETQRN